jgi:predicted TIM-barrel fold metal-dependent hydrolase
MPCPIRKRFSRAGASANVKRGRGYVGNREVQLIIDGHAHAAGSLADADGIIAHLDELGVDRIVLTPGLGEADRDRRMPSLAGAFQNADVMLAVNKVIRRVAGRRAGDLSQRNERVWSLRQQYPDRIEQFYWADPGADDFLEELASKHQAWGFKGIKLHQPIDRFRCDAPALLSMVEFAGERGLPVFVHLYSRQEARRLAELVMEFPRTVFIVAHLIGLELLEGLPRGTENIYFDVSPPQLVSERRVLKAIERFRAARVVMGSDSPYGRGNLELALARVRELDFPESQLSLMLGTNMERLLEQAG